MRINVVFEAEAFGKCEWIIEGSDHDGGCGVVAVLDDHFYFGRLIEGGCTMLRFILFEGRVFFWGKLIFF